MVHARTVIIAIGLISQTIPALCQTDGLLQIDDMSSRFLLRLETKGLLENSHLSHQPISVYEASRHLDSIDVESRELTDLDRATLEMMRGEKPGLGGGILTDWIPKLYENGRDFLSVTGDDYDLQFNPILYLGAGGTVASARPDRDSRDVTWKNTRGVRVSGRVNQTRAVQCYHLGPVFSRSAEVGAEIELRQVG